MEGAISRFGQQLAANQSEPRLLLSFTINVEGATRPLAPILANELYHIAIEALRNAFHHAQARRIEVEIRYGAREFRLRVRDNGKGIDPKVLEAGRDGHYGITGMRERTRLAGGRLVFWSELDSGTELELTIPGLAGLREGLRLRDRLRSPQRYAGYSHDQSNSNSRSGRSRALPEEASRRSSRASRT